MSSVMSRLPRIGNLGVLPLSPSRNKHLLLRACYPLSSSTTSSTTSSSSSLSRGVQARTLAVGKAPKGRKGIDNGMMWRSRAGNEFKYDKPTNEGGGVNHQYNHDNQGDHGHHGDHGHRGDHGDHGDQGDYRDWSKAQMAQVISGLVGVMVAGSLFVLYKNLKPSSLLSSVSSYGGDYDRMYYDNVAARIVASAGEVREFKRRKMEGGGALHGKFWTAMEIVGGYFTSKLMNREKLSEPREDLHSPETSAPPPRDLGGGGSSVNVLVLCDRSPGQEGHLEMVKTALQSVYADPPDGVSEHVGNVSCDVYAGRDEPELGGGAARRYDLVHASTSNGEPCDIGKSRKIETLDGYGHDVVVVWDDQRARRRDNQAGSDALKFKKCWKVIDGRLWEFVS